MFSVYLKNHGIHEKSRNVLQSTARKIVLDLNLKKTESERSKKYLFVTKVDIVAAEIWVFFITT